MEAPELIFVAVVMAIGLLGIVFPVIPGLPIIWAATLYWAVQEGGTAAWLTFAVATVLTVIGTAAKYVLSGRAVTSTGAPKLTVLIGGIAAIVGFFVIPVLGLVIGGALGVLFAEWMRLGSWSQAWTATRTLLIAMGLGVAVELVTGIFVVMLWGTAAFVLRG